MLPVLIGAFVGKSFAEIVFSRAVMLMFVWLLLPWLASWAAISHLHAPWAGYAAGMGTMLAMLAFACTPRPGRTRLALLEGLLLWSGLIMLVAVVRLLFAVIAEGFVAGVVAQARWIGFGLAAIALAALAQWRIDAAMEGEAT